MDERTDCMEMSILDLDACQIARGIQRGEFTSEFATKAFIEQIKKVNPLLNCVVQERFQTALLESQNYDRQFKAGKVSGRLFGVPISMKECFHVADMKTTGGLASRDRIEKMDAAIVSKLKDEGAIILGKTNTPTLCYTYETKNKLYGQTNNPWDLSRTVGGSSGGEGALIAVGGAAVGIGSDIGGSIRFPAHFNGVVGFKSGDGQVSSHGHFPEFKNPHQVGMLGTGAVAKSVDDAELINDIISFNQPPNVDISKIQLIIPAAHPNYPVSQDTVDLLHSIRDKFSSIFTIHQNYPPKFEKMAELLQQISSFGVSDVEKQAFADRKPNFIVEYFKEIALKNSEIHRDLLWALIGLNVFKPSVKKGEKIISELIEAKKQNAEYFKERVLILPIYPSTARPHGEVNKEVYSLKKTFLKLLPYSAVVNVLGLPALAVPVGTDRQGMPISVQLVTSVGNEKALFHFGRIIENTFGGYTRCKMHD